MQSSRRNTTNGRMTAHSDCLKSPRPIFRTLAGHEKATRDIGDFCTGHMGNTFPHASMGESVDAAEREFGKGGTSALCRPSAGWGRNERGVPGVRDLAQDRL